MPFRLLCRTNALLTRQYMSFVMEAGIPTLGPLMSGRLSMRLCVLPIRKPYDNGETQLMKRQFQSAEFTASGSLSFISKWAPVLKHPDQQIRQLSVTGYKELYVVLSYVHNELLHCSIPFPIWRD